MNEEELYQLLKDALDDPDSVLSWKIRAAFQKALETREDEWTTKEPKKAGTIVIVG